MSEFSKSLHERIMGDSLGLKGSSQPTDVSVEGVIKERRVSRSIMFRIGIGAFALSSVVAVGSFAMWSAGVFPFIDNSSAIAADGQKQETSQAAENVFADHAKGTDSKTCGETYAVLGSVLTEGSQYMVETEAAQENADAMGLRGIVSMAIGTPEYSGPGAGFVFTVPSKDVKCVGQLVKVVPVPQSCVDFAQTLPPGAQRRDALGSVQSFVLDGGQRLMLVPASAGCVAVSILNGAKT